MGIKVRQGFKGRNESGMSGVDVGTRLANAERTDPVNETDALDYFGSFLERLTANRQRSTIAHVDPLALVLRSLERGPLTLTELQHETGLPIHAIVASVSEALESGTVAVVGEADEQRLRLSEVGSELAHASDPLRQQ